MRASARSVDRSLGAEATEIAAAEHAALRTNRRRFERGNRPARPGPAGRFINRAFRGCGELPTRWPTASLHFFAVLFQGRGRTASTVSHHLLADYATKQLDLIQTGEERPLQIRLTNGDVIQFRCTALPDGGRLLTYGNVSELARQADAMRRLASIDAMTEVNNRRHFSSSPRTNGRG